MKEIWKDIPEYEGFYKASNKGRIKSINRSVGHFSEVKRQWVGKVLKLTENHGGYLFVSLSKEGNIKNWLVHRLVAMAFIPNPENKATVNHKDSNKKNNNVDNLEWATYSENHIHAFENGFRESVKGSNNGLSKLTENEVLEMRAAHRLGCFTHKELGDAYGICSSTVCSILNRDTWKHI